MPSNISIIRAARDGVGLAAGSAVGSGKYSETVDGFINITSFMVTAILMLVQTF
jgi:hypothetical protein